MTTISNQVLNEYNFEEERTPERSIRTIKWKGTNDAVKNLTSVFSMGTEKPPRTVEYKSSNDVISPDDQRDALPNIPSFEATDEVTNSVREQAESSNVTKGEHENSLAREYFKSDGEDDIKPTRKLSDYLKLPGLTKKNKQQHFMVMYVSAYSDWFDKPVSDVKLEEVVKREKVHDPSNFKLHFNDAIEQYLIREGDNLLRLHNDGEKLVETVIEHTQTPPPEIASTTRGASRNKRSKGELSKRELEAIRPWLEEDASRAFDTAKLYTTATKWALYVLYLLTEDLKVTETVRSSLAYVYASQKFLKLPVDRKSFINAFSHLKGSGKATLSQDKKYYLSPKGKTEIEKLLSEI